MPMQLALTPPRACLGRQLGVSLHALGSRLPLYDGVTGAPIPEGTDARVERVTQHTSSFLACCATKAAQLPCP